MLAKLRRRLLMAGRVLITGDSEHQVLREVPSITPEEVAEARAIFPLDKFFILGHARSGTTLLARLVRLHPEVHCNYQAHFFTRPPLLQSLVASKEVEAWLARRSNRWNHGRDLSPLVLRAVADFILEREARPLGVRIVGDKSPNSLLGGEAVRLMHKVYPEARLVYIVRDGRDTAISHRFQAFIDAAQHLTNEDLRIRREFYADPGPFLRGERSLFTPQGARLAAESWTRNVCETERAAKELYGDRFRTLRYEDLLSNPWESLSQLWQFLGAGPGEPSLKEAVLAEAQRNPDSDWQQEKAGELVGQLPKGQPGLWRQLFTPFDCKVFREIAGPTLLAWKYEANLDW